MGLLNDLRARAGIRTLLSSDNSNPKTAKSAKLNILTFVLHLAPGNMSGHEVCPKRSPGCSAACLHFAGNPLHQSRKDAARVKKTRLFFADRNLFMNILVLEMANAIQRAERKGMTPAFRLNATSDIVWELKKFILWPETIQLLLKRKIPVDTTRNVVTRIFPNFQFYDYTAIPRRTPGENYHLTFSMKEQNMDDVIGAKAQGLNIAVVFPTKELPDTYLGLPVINGDDHDYRPSDPRPCVVGLKVKGVKGKADKTGFVQSTNSPGELQVA